MWGYANHKNRELANWLFILLIDEKISNSYNRNNASMKGRDQHFLSDYFWPIAKENATIHASYFCNKYGVLGKPFPTQRPKHFCFIPCSYCCDEIFLKKLWTDLCPMECRPKNHKDWIYC